MKENAALGGGGAGLCLHLTTDTEENVWTFDDRRNVGEPFICVSPNEAESRAVKRWGWLKPPQLKPCRYLMFSSHHPFVQSNPSIFIKCCRIHYPPPPKAPVCTNTLNVMFTVTAGKANYLKMFDHLSSVLQQ